MSGTPSVLPPARVAVIGGGISGLTAAYRLRTLLGPQAQIALVDGAKRLGGAVRTAELAGLALDVGAEAFLARRPEVGDLVAELGMTAELTHPTSAAATVRAAGRRCRLPTRTLMGIPADPADLTEVLSADAVRRVAAEPSTPLRWQPGQDASVGALLRERAGDELVDRLVDPLLGGVYAGRADALGLRATLPALAAALDRGAGSLLTAAAECLPPPPSPAAGGVRPPVFATLRGGLAGLVRALERAAAARIWRGLPARRLDRTPRGWRLELGSAAQPRFLDADAVVLAVPAPALRRLLTGPVPAAGAALERVEVASSVVVALALPLPAADALPQASGVLVASGEPVTAKAFTFSGRKWAHARDERVLLVRASLGRHGEAPLLRRDDAELIEVVRADLAALTGVSAEPVDTVVARWGGGLPQYAPGHLDVVDAVERAVATQPSLAVAGALLRGVGLPACVASAEAAARRVAEHLRSTPPSQAGVAGVAARSPSETMGS